MTTRLRLNTKQAAEHSGRNVTTILKALESGELHGGQRKVKGRWSIRIECLDAWCDGEPCEHQTAGAA